MVFRGEKVRTLVSSKIMILLAVLHSWPFFTVSWSSKYLCYNYNFLQLQIWLLFCFHGSLKFSIPADIPVMKFLRDLYLLFSISAMCILQLLLKIWIMTQSPSGCLSLIVITLSGEFCELSHLVENSNENISNEESLGQEIADYLFFRRHDKLMNAHIFCFFLFVFLLFSDKQSTFQFSISKRVVALSMLIDQVFPLY